VFSLICGKSAAGGLSAILLATHRAWMWAREPKEADGTRPGEQESPRWIDGDQRVAELAEQLPQTGLVYVGDRESDMLELMVQARDSGYQADSLLRAQHNRA